MNVAGAVGAAVGVHNEGGCSGSHDGDSGGDEEVHVGGIGGYLDVGWILEGNEMGM